MPGVAVLGAALGAGSAWGGADEGPVLLQAPDPAEGGDCSRGQDSAEVGVFI